MFNIHKSSIISTFLKNYVLKAQLHSRSRLQVGRFSKRKVQPKPPKNLSVLRAKQLLPNFDVRKIVNYYVTTVQNVRSTLKSLKFKPSSNRQDEKILRPPHETRTKQNLKEPINKVLSNNAKQLLSNINMQVKMFRNKMQNFSSRNLQMQLHDKVSPASNETATESSPYQIKKNKVGSMWNNYIRNVRKKANDYHQIYEKISGNENARIAWKELRDSKQELKKAQQHTKKLALKLAALKKELKETDLLISQCSDENRTLELVKNKNNIMREEQETTEQHKIAIHEEGNLYSHFTTDFIKFDKADRSQFKVVRFINKTTRLLLIIIGR